MNIAILCSGGDSCGMNPAIKSFVDYCFENHHTPFFVYEGYEGLIEGKIERARHKDVAGILHLGGTIIKSSRSKRFFEAKYRKLAYEHLQEKQINHLIVLGGDGSFKGINIFAKEFDINCIGVPTTIDNDICGSQYALGVDTALNVIKDALDDIRDTSSSFKRAFVVETMGRASGYLAAVSSIASGAEICVIPEKDYNLKSIKKRLLVELENGREYILAIVAEGTQKTNEIAKFIENSLQIETRVLVLGHIQRGGNPTVFERLTANEFITLSLKRFEDNHNIQEAVLYQKGDFYFSKIDDLVCNTKTLDKKILKQINKMTR